MLTRRGFVIAAGYLLAATIGIIGGLTAEEDGVWGDDDEPPRERNGHEGERVRERVGSRS